MRFGGRWNAPGTFPVVYLNADRETARANARLLLTKGFSSVFVSAEDLDPTELPSLIATVVTDDQYVDIVSDDGCVAAGLPTTYPLDVYGQQIAQSSCQPIGATAWADGDLGIACRSAAPSLPSGSEELAYFDRPGRKLQPVGDPVPFDAWYGPIDW
jgi:RES domain-containing protein